MPVTKVSFHVVSSSWREEEEEEEWGGGLRQGEEGEIAIAHLYSAIKRPGTNVLTFVLVCGYDRYKCNSLTFVPDGATARYKCVAFVPSGWEMALARPCESSNRYKCSYLYRGIKYSVQIIK
jgi:hypothetical protein